jgi:hypothetical protein
MLIMATFDFDCWQAWLRGKVSELQTSGAEFSVGGPSPKPGVALSMRSATVLAQMRIWCTGEADYEIMDLRTRKFLDPGGPLQVSDTSFEAAIEDFLQRVSAAQ